MTALDERASLDDLKRQLDDQAEDIARYLHGEPSTEGRHECRWGRRGSVQLIRRKAGRYWPVGAIDPWLAS